MKQLIRRLSRVADSSQYCSTLLRSNSLRSRGGGGHGHEHEGVSTSTKRCVPVPVPEGYLPVYVGEEMELMERFVVSAELLNHPIFIQLLNKSAQEYGYHQKGVLRIPCHVIVFQRVLQALRDGNCAADSCTYYSSSSSS